MRKLKTYNLFTESIRDLMTPKSKEDIDKSIKKTLGKLKPNNLLIKSIEFDYLEGVKTALEKGADVHFTNDWALGIASRTNKVEIVKVLLDAGANINAANFLSEVSQRGHTQMVKLLLDRGKFNDLTIISALSNAIFYGHTEIVKLILATKPNLNKFPTIINNSLKRATKERYDEIVNMIKEYENTNESVRDLMTPKSKEDIKNELSKISPHKLLGELSEMGIKLTDVYTEEEILELDPEVLLDYSFWTNYIKGIKYVLDNYKLYGKHTKFIISCHMPDIELNNDLRYLLNEPQIKKFLSSDEVYVLEKYRLGMHKGETREYEQILIDLLEKAEYYQSKKDADIMICEGEKEYELYFNYNRRTHKLRYHIDNFAGYLRIDKEDRSGDSKYGFGRRYDDLLISGVVGEFCNLTIDIVDGARATRPAKPGYNVENFVWE